jgi:hypothetical protein
MVLLDIRPRNRVRSKVDRPSRSVDPTTASDRLSNSDESSLPSGRGLVPVLKKLQSFFTPSELRWR